MKVKIIVSIIILAVAFATIAILKKNKPVVEKEEKPRILPLVEVLTAQPDDYAIVIHTQGTIEAATITTAASQVSGKIIKTTSIFERGEFFKKGDLFLEIEKTDYETAIERSQSAIAQAKLTLEVEKARAEQAARDWKKLGGQGAPNSLALRKPQLAAAQASLAAARADLTRAKNDLARTSIYAPYDGRVVQTFTDIGNFVAPGAQLLKFYDTTRLQVRLPIQLDEYQRLKLIPPPPVQLTASYGGKQYLWTGKIVRTEGEIDRQNRSIYIVAELANPGEAILSPGLFVKAEIEGETLKNCYKIPRSSIVGTDQVVTINSENHIATRLVRIGHADTDYVYVVDGIKSGEKICLTTLPSVINGTEVEITKQK